MSYISLKNIYASGTSQQSSIIPPSGPYLIYQSNNQNAQTWNLLNNNSIANNTITVDKIVSGNNGYVLSSLNGSCVWIQNSASGQYSDNVFEVYNANDNSKILKISCSDIPSLTNLTLTMAPYSINLQNMISDSFNIRDSTSNHTLSLLTPILGNNISLTFPNNTGSNGQVLSTNGNGILSWSNPISSNTFLDNVFRIQNWLTPSKQMAIDCSHISPNNIRTLTMSDYDNDLNQFLTSSLSLKSNGFSSKLQTSALTGNLIFNLPNYYGVLNQALLTDGFGNLTWGVPTIFPVDDITFRIFNTVDNTKQLLFNLSAIGNNQIRTLTMANRNLNLQNPIFDSIQLYNSSTGYINLLQTSNTQTNNITYNLPSNTGVNNYVLCTDSSSPILANLSWKNVSTVLFPISDSIFTVYSNSDITQKINFQVSNNSPNSIMTLKTPQSTTLNGSTYDYENPICSSVKLYNNTKTLATTIQAPNQSTNITYNMPNSYGSSGQVLSTDGNNPCQLNWSTPAVAMQNIFKNTVAGSYSFTVPNGIYLLYVILIGGGSGSNGLNNIGTTNSGYSANGSAGGWIEAYINVTPLQVISYIIGVGGTAGAPNTTGGTGGNSYFGGTNTTNSLIWATGGICATVNTTNSIGLGGIGGIGSIVPTGFSYIIGQGGSSCGYNAQSGNNLMTQVPGSCTWKFQACGGVGRTAGAGSFLPAITPIHPGCGGSGCLSNQFNGSQNGVAGNPGAIYIYY